MMKKVVNDGRTHHLIQRCEEESKNETPTYLHRRRDFSHPYSGNKCENKLVSRN